MWCGVGCVDMAIVVWTVARELCGQHWTFEPGLKAFDLGVSRVRFRVPRMAVLVLVSGVLVLGSFQVGQQARLQLYRFGIC